MLCSSLDERETPSASAKPTGPIPSRRGRKPGQSVNASSSSSEPVSAHATGPTWSTTERRLATGRGAKEAERATEKPFVAISNATRNASPLSGPCKLRSSVATSGDRASVKLSGCDRKDRLHAHHHRPDRPLDVVFLCQNPHHEFVHHIGPLRLKASAGRRWARAPRHEARAS